MKNSIRIFGLSGLLIASATLGLAQSTNSSSGSGNSGKSSDDSKAPSSGSS